MRLDVYVQALREDLLRVAAIGDESTALAAELLAIGLDSSFGRRLQEALGEAALELSQQLDSGWIEIRVAGGDPELVYVHREVEAASGESPDETFAARITLRLPATLKARLEAAAARTGLSVNTWVVQRLNEIADARPGGSRYRLSGYGQS
jgi:hypothetical protein